MPDKIFISYSSRDQDKVEILESTLRGSKIEIEPIIIATRKKPKDTLADKVREGIVECTHFAPIVTRRSIDTQWINQEIGFSQALDRIPLVLVESSLLPRLKGFIHSQNDLPFMFDGSWLSGKKENKSFSKSCELILEYLDRNDPGDFSASISPTIVNQGQSYQTTINFRGQVQHGFFDNYVENVDTGKYFWHPDPQTFVRRQDMKSDVTPGTLNGQLSIKNHSFESSTLGMPSGHYKVFVRLYEHLIPGVKGRQKVKESVHSLEVR